MKEIKVSRNSRKTKYDANSFDKFLIIKKGEAGADLGNWSLPDLKIVIKEFINKNKQKEENIENKKEEKKEE